MVFRQSFYLPRQQQPSPHKYYDRKPTDEYAPVLPDRNKNCYILPVFAYRKWLLRAGFYYGNYDGQSRPPTFDLQFDGNLWATVTTSLDEPSFFEVIMIPTRENVSICLARTVDGGVPFISSLEILELGMNMYGWMQGNQVLFKEYRLNFGATEMVRYPDDEYDRFWDPAIPTGYKTVTADYPSLNQSVDDDPPLTVIKTAIEAPSPSDKIILSFPVPQQRSIYVTLYFTEVRKFGPDQNRTFEVYLTGKYYSLVLSPRYQICDEISWNADGWFNQTFGWFNVTLSPLNDSNLPPIISAMELFTVKEYQLQSTFQDDLNGLESFSYQSMRLYKWTGDPCLPSNSTWEWLSCNDKDPPRVTAIYLSGYNLMGYLQNFSQMEALEIIDLHNNNLRGPIPDFLGEFPNLRVLNLANNNFEGSIPKSILNNDRISFNASGNPELKFPKKKKKKIGLIVGLTIGMLIVVVVLCLIVTAFLRRSRKRREQEAARGEPRHLQVLNDHEDSEVGQYGQLAK